jgi:outer membrane protein assembly factor BamE (lipoprotein component of BamABCDE complex)
MFTKKNLVRVLTATVFLFLAACSSPEKAPESKIQMGMDKAAVLEALGTPKKTGRIHGSDRWTYETTVNGQVEKTDVYFQEGKVTYFGAPRAEDLKVLKSGKGFKDVTGTEPAATPTPAK